jgi:hypothetical protein
MIIQELVGKKVVVHVESGSNVVQHRGILESVDSSFPKLKKDNETLFFTLVNVLAVQSV